MGDFNLKQNEYKTFLVYYLLTNYEFADKGHDGQETTVVIVLSPSKTFKVIIWLVRLQLKIRNHHPFLLAEAYM